MSQLRYTQGVMVLN